MEQVANGKMQKKQNHNSQEAPIFLLKI